MSGKKSVLIIDDSLTEVMSLMEALQSDYVVKFAESGVKGLELAATSPQPDVVLLDVAMPGMDGYETCRLLKHEPTTRNIEVIFISGYGDADQKLVGYDAGAWDYLTKPLQSEEVIQKIRLAIKSREMREESDLTHEQLVEAQSQLLQSEKMAAIGQLAAGVAHEINNPVGYINSNIGTLRGYVHDLFRMLQAYQQLEQHVVDDHQILTELNALKKELDLDYLQRDIVDLINESQEGVTRVRQIVQDLKDFSRVDDAEWHWANLHQGIDSTLNIVHNELKYKADVIKQYGELPEVECISAQINQVVMNLLVNAAHAIEGHGTITIRTGTVEKGDQVWVSIADTGKGIEKNNLKKVFNPFFTTKPVGKGTGLGLSLAYRILEKHGGRIAVESAPGNTVFTFWLPVKHLGDKGETVVEAVIAWHSRQNGDAIVRACGRCGGRCRFVFVLWFSRRADPTQYPNAGRGGVD